MQQDRIEPYANSARFEEDLAKVLAKDYGIILSDREGKDVSLNFIRLLNQFL